MDGDGDGALGTEGCPSLDARQRGGSAKLAKGASAVGAANCTPRSCTDVVVTHVGDADVVVAHSVDANVVVNATMVVNAKAGVQQVAAAIRMHAEPMWSSPM